MVTLNKRELIAQIQIVEPYLSRENKKLYRVLQDKIQTQNSYDTYLTLKSRWWRRNNI